MIMIFNSYYYHITILITYIITIYSNTVSTNIVI